jgi:hypothetical protein
MARLIQTSQICRQINQAEGVLAARFVTLHQE